MKRRMGLIALAVCLWLATSACSCWSLLDSPRSGQDSETSPPTVAATRTPRPTFTPYPTLPTPTKTPPKPGPTPVPADPPAIPSEPNTPFVVELTQAQLDEYLRGETFQEQGVTVTDVKVVLAESAVVCNFQASQNELGISVGITVRGVPTVSDGVAYFKVEHVSLDDSLRGFSRLIARATVERAIDEYSTPQGIPIPADEIEFHSIDLLPGKIVVVGRTR